MAGTPHIAPGCRIDPPVSVPSDATANPAATAAADPPLDPPGMRSVASGFSTGPYAEFSFELPIANSSQFVLPKITAPAFSSRATAVASYGGTYFSRIFEPQVVVTPRVLNTSFTATGTPARGGNGLPAATIASTRSACAYARSSESARNAFNFGFCAAIREKCSFANSRAEIFFAARAVRTLSIVQFSAILLFLGLSLLHYFVASLLRFLTLDYLRYTKIRRLRIRRLLQQLRRSVTRNFDVLAQRGIRRLIVRQHLRHRLDIRRIELVQFSNVIENFVELFSVGRKFFFGEIEVRQFRHAQNIFAADFQEATSAPFL